ncbi:MAG TPA: polysaccharide deacetylase family protein [Nevskiaceae bacterium]|nr:polysaccharide deacetylase family protein [Nevskiaceae bacterium]
MKQAQPFLLRVGGKGLLAVILVALVVIPIVGVYGWAKAFGWIDPRKHATQIPLQERAIDKTVQAPKLFQEPLLSVTFDDGWESVFTVAYPLLQRYGIQTTQYALSGTLDDQKYMSIQQLRAMQATGHQIACHTVNHADLTTLDTKELNYQLKGCKDTFGKLLGPMKDFASPYSSYDETSIAAIKKYFRSHRNTDGDPTNGVGDPDVNVPDNFDIYNLTAVTVRRDTTPASIQKLIDYARKHNAWLILTYHAIDESKSNYGLDTKQLEAQLREMSTGKIRIAPVDEVLDTYISLPPEF